MFDENSDIDDLVCRIGTTDFPMEVLSRGIRA